MFFAVLEQSRVILSQAARARYIVICTNPAFTKMIDGTEKPKISSKFAKRAMWYNEFRCNTVIPIVIAGRINKQTGHENAASWQLFLIVC